MEQIIFQIIGMIVVLLFILFLLHKVFRYFTPKKYNWNNCPRDHDTLARYGAVRCDKCNNKL